MRVVLMLFLLSTACSDEREPEPGIESAPPERGQSPTEAVENAPEPDEPATPEPSSEPVDLLHAVPVTIGASSAYREEVGQVERLFDGDLETAWNSRTGDLQGSFIELDLPRDVEVTDIEMTVGYTKTSNGRDLFVGNHRVRRVRVLRDGAEVASRELAIDDRELQSLGVTGPGGRYRIELTELVAGDHASWREACVSEIRVTGRGGTAGSSTPRAQVGALAPLVEPNELGEGDEGSDGGEDDPDYGALAAEEQGGGDEGGDEGEGESGAHYLAARDGLHLSELVLAAGVENRQPVDPRTTFSKASDERVYCYLRVENPDREEATVYMAWERAEGRAPTDQSREMQIRAMPTYVTFAFTGTARRAGRWACVIRNDNDEVLGRAEFDLTE
jgi:hypothetical protein